MDDTTAAAAPLSPAERQLVDFYAWERRGRGWWVWPHAVEIEPPFRPFPPEFSNAPTLTDDAHKPTLVSKLVASLVRKEREPDSGITDDGPSEGEEPWPDLDATHPDLTEFSVSLPPDLKVSGAVAGQVLASLPAHLDVVSFELIGTSKAITVQWATRREDAGVVERQLLAHFPEIALEESSEALRQAWGEAKIGTSLLVDFGLSNEFLFPLDTGTSFQTDPLVGIVGAMEGLRGQEVAVLQVLFRRVRHPWSGNMLRGAELLEGSEPKSLARAKASEPLFAAVIRVAARSEDEDRTWDIVRSVGGALGPLARTGSNELIPLSNADYPDDEHELDLLERTTHRSGMILNLGELVALVHLPSPVVRSESLRRERRTTREAPTLTQGPGLVLGENDHRGRTATVHLPSGHRLRHMHVLGATGTGKSHFLLSLILQDIENGEGVGVLDPHGDLIDRILERIPEERHGDVVLLDPADEDFPIAFNILSAHSELERNLLASDLVAAFRRLATSWGDQMTSVLRNAVLAFLESDEGGTLADLRRFLVEPGFRTAFLQTVRDEEVVYFWQREFPLLSGRPQGPLLTRLDSFLAPKPLRRMVSQRESRLDFAEIMDQGQIFLARLSQGAIGEENAHLLGSLLAAKFQQLAAARQAQAEADRRSFFLYVDEFQHFATPSMTQILGGARKYGLGLTLAHQDLAQLDQAGTGLASAVLSNPATRVCFRVGDSDARKLSEGFASFEAKDLSGLGRGEAICRVERSDWDFNLRTLPLLELEPSVGMDRVQRIVALSRARYGTPRDVVEEALRRGRTSAPGPPTAPESPPEAPEIPKEAPAPRRASRPVLAATKLAEPQPLGRGGAQHRYLQELIKRWAGSRGWHVTVEQPILDGLGRVDVSLERSEQRVACEVAVKSTPDQEVGNVQKCLAAGFDAVAVVSPERKVLGRAQAAVEAAVEEESLSRIEFLTPEELFVFLEALEAHGAGGEETIRGWKVKTRFQSLEEGDKSTRTQAIAKVILGATKRLRGKDA